MDSYDDICAEKVRNARPTLFYLLNNLDTRNLYDTTLTQYTIFDLKRSVKNYENVNLTPKYLVISNVIYDKLILDENYSTCLIPSCRHLVEKEGHGGVILGMDIFLPQNIGIKWPNNCMCMYINESAFKVALIKA